MSRPETDDSSNDGSGTDSEDDQKKLSTETSSNSESENESEANDSRFRVMKNSEEKRPRDAVAAAAALVDSANKRLKTLGGKPAASTQQPDAPLKPPPAPAASNRNVSPAPAPPPPKSGGAKKPAAVEGKKGAEAEKKKEAEKEATPKKVPQAWTTEDEHALVLHIFKDMKAGLKPPKRGSRGENYHYWGDLHEQCQGKFSTAWSKEQLYDKYRRMKSRYDAMVDKERAEGVTALKFKSPGEEKIYNLWKQMYEIQEQEEPPEAPKQGDNAGKKTPTAGGSSQQRAEDEAGKSVRKTRSAAPPPPAAAAVAAGGSSKQKPDQEQRSNGAAEEKAASAFASTARELQKKMFSEAGKLSFGDVSNGLAAGRFGGLNEWLMMSMRNSSPLLGMEMMVPPVFGAGAGGSGLFGGITDPKLREGLLRQQLEELRVMEQRFRLLQELCHYEQELLKKQQQQQSR